MKHYKVLLITAFGKPWNNGWFYKAGFEKNGHNVLHFDPAGKSNAADRAVSIIKKFNPDFIVHTKNELPADIFEEFRSYTRVIQWYPDPVIPDWLPPYVSASDIFLTMSEGLIDEFKRYNENTFWLTQAFEPSFFEIKNITKKDIEIFSSDIAFVGNLGSQFRYLARRETLKEVINAGFKFKWWGPRIPRKFSTIPLMLGKLGRAYGSRFVWGEDYAKVARLSKVFLAFDSQPHIRKSMSARMYTAVGCGAFYMCTHVDGIEDVLVPDREIITFRDDNEMLDKMKFFLENDALRKKIAEAGRKRISREHTYEIRIRQMIDIINHVIQP